MMMQNTSCGEEEHMMTVLQGVKGKLIRLWLCVWVETVASTFVTAEHDSMTWGREGASSGESLHTSVHKSLFFFPSIIFSA